MAPSIAADAIVGLIGCAAFIVFWLGPRRWLVTDSARNAMFAAREAFFDEAAAGRISFSDPNYLKVREAINANIRFAHMLGIVRVYLHLRGLRASGSQLSGRTEARTGADAIGNPTAKLAAHRALNSVESAALRLLFLRSPMLGALVVVSALGFNASRWGDRASVKQLLRGALQPYSDAIQAEALIA